MPKCRGKKETTKRVNNTGRRSRASQLQAARGNRRKATFAAVDLEAVTGDLPRSQPGSVSVTDRHGAGGSALNVTASSSKRKFDMMCAASSASSGDSDDVDVTSDHRDSDDPGANTRSPVTDDSCLFVQVSSLKNIVKNLPCPNCQGAFLTVEIIDVQ
ncbi:hypothetical protein LSAT2_003196, partial [Lamellibrachia satsuma]